MPDNAIPDLRPLLAQAIGEALREALNQMWHPGHPGDGPLIQSYDDIPALAANAVAERMERVGKVGNDGLIADEMAEYGGAFMVSIEDDDDERDEPVYRFRAPGGEGE